MTVSLFLVGKVRFHFQGSVCVFLGQPRAMGLCLTVLLPTGILITIRGDQIHPFTSWFSSGGMQGWGGWGAFQQVSWCGSWGARSSGSTALVLSSALANGDNCSVPCWSGIFLWQGAIWSFYTFSSKLLSIGYVQWLERIWNPLSCSNTGLLVVPLLLSQAFRPREGIPKRHAL